MSDLGVIVTGVLIGSASGIGGAVLGAWMNGRQQMAALKLNIDTEKARAHTAEKRRLYAAYLARFNELLTVLLLYSAAQRSWPSEPLGEADEQRRLAGLRELAVAQHAATSALNELTLIAPDDVQKPSSLMFDDVIEVLKKVRAGDREAEHNGRRVDAFLDRMYKAMRADLDKDESPGQTG